jgi:hypothetical protein
MRFSWLVVFVACTAAPPASELEALRKARDYFSLREELQKVADRDDPET